MDILLSLPRMLPPMGSRKSPQLAAIIGFLFGGIGLGIYFWSFIDVMIPIAIIVALSLSAGPQLGILVGAVVASVWGYLRALDSNMRQ